MIKDKKTAQHISKTLLKCSADINDSIAFVLSKSSNEDFESYRSAMAKVLGEILFEGLEPLYKDHPELMPDEMKI